MFIRKIGSLLRGKVTAFQVFAAAILGALLGFAPGFQEGPAFYLILMTLLLVVNANLFFALFVAGGAKVLAILLAPYSFQLGQLLMDGPAGGVVGFIVNTPVLAWSGLESYAVVGGLVIAICLGAVIGLTSTFIVGSFRRRIIAAQGSPSRLQHIGKKPVARFLMWLFFGSKTKKTWEEKVEKRIGNPVRMWGVAVLAIVLGGLYYAQATLASPMARDAIQVSLEKVNGATVDIGGFTLDLAGGRLAMGKVAMADREKLDHDLFRAAQLEADLDTADLLRRRFHVTKLVVSNLETSVPRGWPGELIGMPDVAPAEPEVVPGEELNLEQVLANYSAWKERLTQMRRWMDLLAGSEQDPDVNPDAAPDVAESPTSPAGDSDAEALAERIARQAEAHGWYSIHADHLVEDAPRFRLSELVIDGIAASGTERVFDVKGFDLSTHPQFVDAPPRLEIASRDGQVSFAIDLAPVSKQGGDGALRFAWRGLSVDNVMAELRFPDAPPLQGGTMDLEIDGAWDQGRIGYVNLPLTATLYDTVLHMNGLDPTPLDELVLPIEISGPIDSPRIRFRASTLTDALVAAGKEEIAARVNELKGRAQEELDERTDEMKDKASERLSEEVPDELKEKLADPKKTLRSLFGNKGEGPR